MASVFPKTDRPEGLRGVGALRRDPAVRAIVQNWRILTAKRERGEGSRTVIACSGGADSCALVCALATVPRATDRFVIAHVVHDLRPEAETLADRDAARGLAERLGFEFVEAAVCVRTTGGNLEASARGLRYAALVEIARHRRIGFIATAHHADDQLETVVMSLLRGAAGGGAGVRGMAARRRIGVRDADAVTLVRPMLTPGAEVDRAACHRVCKLASVEWREDATNTDVSRLRAAVRHRIAPVLRELRPDVGRRAMAAAAHADAATARLARSARALMRQGEWTDNAGEWPRPTLRKRDPLVLGALLRQARRRLCGRAGEDRVSKRSIDAAVRAIQDRTTDPRRCVVGGMEVEVTARRVVVSRR